MGFGKSLCYMSMCARARPCALAYFSAWKQQGVGRSLPHSEYLGKCTPGDQIIQSLSDYLIRSTSSAKYLIR